MKFPWGEYKGKEMSEIPLTYLKYIFSTLVNPHTALYGAVLDEINRRKKK
jgi:uncharacterized protein (DUF3820 family)